MPRTYIYFSNRLTYHRVESIANQVDNYLFEHHRITLSLVKLTDVYFDLYLQLLRFCFQNV